MAHLFARHLGYYVAMKNKALLLVGLILITLVACASDGSVESEPQHKAITIVASDIAYDVERIEATAGQPINLTLENQGVLEHDFSIVEIPLHGEVTTEHAEESEEHDMSEVGVEPAVHVAAAADGRSTIEFTPASPGQYTYYCTVSGHREAGMEGVLVVK